MRKESMNKFDYATAALYATPGTEPKRKPRKKRTAADGPTESQIQKACVKWFDAQYPELYYNLWAVPNGGARNAVTGANLKAEGVRPGVSDLMFFCHGRLHCIEMKKPGGRQSDAQKAFEQSITKGMFWHQGAQYHIIDNLDDFMRLIREVVG